MSHTSKAADQRLHERFTFYSSAIPEGTQCKVVRFSGTEGINHLYSFTISLISDSPLPLDNLFLSVCTLRIGRDGAKPARFHGYLKDIVQGAHINGWTFYTVELVPQFSALRSITHNFIYLDQDIQGIITEAMKHCGLIQPPYEFKLTGTYPIHEFRMQYNENLYDYIAFHMEREGVYYYFDQTGDNEKLIFTDAPMQHTSLKETPTLRYYPTSGLEGGHAEEVIVSFTLRQHRMPNKVYVRDYNWKKPNFNLEASALVDERGLGTLFFHGDGFDSVEEGTRLARIRAEGLLCRKKLFSGISSVPSICPGYTFTLENHYDRHFNASYLVTDIIHEGSQEAYLSSVLSITLENPTDTLYYRNSFTCIPAETQFRPERKTERKKISGMLHAFIDSASTANTPEIDSYGRYKVIFPQDASGKESGKASCWIRRAQQSVGLAHGTMFPLAPGVEVLIGFIDGDPDKPFISSAIPNAETGSVDNASTNLLTGVTAAGGGGLVFHNAPEKQAFNLTTGSGRAGIYMSSGSDAAALFQTAYNTGYTASFDATLTGLASSTISGVSTGIMAGGATWHNYALIGLSVASSIMSPISDAAMNCGDDKLPLKMTGSLLGALNDAIKMTSTIITMMKEYYITGLVKSGAPYGSTVLGSSGKSAVFLNMEVTKKSKAALFLTQILSIAATALDAAGAFTLVGAESAVDDAERANVQSQLDIVQSDNYESSVAYDACVAQQKLALRVSQAHFLVPRGYSSMEAYLAENPTCEELLTFLQTQGFSAPETGLIKDENGTIVGFDAESYAAYLCTTVMEDSLKERLEQLDSALRKSAKKLASSGHVATSATTLIAEFITVFTLYQRYNFIRDFGGVRILSPDKNVAITAKTNTYVGSPMGVTVISLPEADACPDYQFYTELCDLHNMYDPFHSMKHEVVDASPHLALALASTAQKIPSLNMQQHKGYVVTETEQVRTVAYEDAQYMSLKGTTIHSGTNIHITNKLTMDATPLPREGDAGSPTPFIKQYTQIFNKIAQNSTVLKRPSVLQGSAYIRHHRSIEEVQQAVGNFIHTTSSNTYSEILFQNDTNDKHLTIHNTGTKLSITQVPETKDKESVLELVRKNAESGANTVTGSLTMDKEHSELLFAAGGDAAKNRTLTLSDTSIKSAFDANVFSEMKDKSLTLQVTKDASIVMTDKESTLKNENVTVTASKDISIQSTKGDVDIGAKNNITLGATSTGIIIAEATRQVTVAGTLIKIG